MARNRRYGRKLDDTVVAAAHNDSHSQQSVTRAVRCVFENLSPSVDSIIKKGDKVLVKVNMGCTGFRVPQSRHTSHPAYVQAIIECLQDCGARVKFGDDVSRSPRHIDRLWQTTGMSDVAKRTGARLVDFVSAGGCEVRGQLAYPRTYFITNLVFEADVVVNAANCRSLSAVVMSGAIKNMFGTMLGTRKARIHAMFPDISDFSRVLVDIFQTVQPDISFLDLTSVIEGHPFNDAIREVGLIVGSVDTIALDTVAAHAIGYQDLKVWTTIHGNAVGLGCNDINRIQFRGIDWAAFPKKSLLYPSAPRTGRGSLYDRVTRFANHTVFRERPVIAETKCTGCGDCASRCPASVIGSLAPGRFSIDYGGCADCGICIKVCESEAVALRSVGLGKAVRQVLRKLKPERLGIGTGNGSGLTAVLALIQCDAISIQTWLSVFAELCCQG